MKMLTIAGSPYISLGFNFTYAVANCVLGFLARSWWFITLGVYYAVLTTTRFSVLKIKRKAGGDYGVEQFASRITGILLVVLSFCIIGVNVLSAREDRGAAFQKIVMIAIATYTFAKITMAIIGMVQSRHTPSPVGKILRNISLADACVSVYAMQRSMLVSFPGMEEADIQLFNILTGSAVWVVVLLLGINLIGGKYTVLAKSKIAKGTQKMAVAVTGGYKKIEQGVVGGYKKIEKGVVGGYTKIEDRFVAAYLTRDNETVEEAKKRLKENQHKPINQERNDNNMGDFFKKAFSDMKESAKAQHQVDKAEFAAAKAEAKANFEENRGRNTFAKAKADAKKNWNDAHMSPAERNAKMQEERDAKIADAQARIEAANARYEEAKR